MKLFAVHKQNITKQREKWEEKIEKQKKKKNRRDRKNAAHASAGRMIERDNHLRHNGITHSRHTILVVHTFFPLFLRFFFCWLSIHLVFHFKWQFVVRWAKHIFLLPQFLHRKHNNCCRCHVLSFSLMRLGFFSSICSSKRIVKCWCRLNGFCKLSRMHKNCFAWQGNWKMYH